MTGQRKSCCSPAISVRPLVATMMPSKRERLPSILRASSALSVFGESFAVARRRRPDSRSSGRVSDAASSHWLANSRPPGDRARRVRVRVEDVHALALEGAVHVQLLARDDGERGVEVARGELGAAGDEVEAPLQDLALDVAVHDRGGARCRSSRGRSQPRPPPSGSGMPQTKYCGPGADGRPSRRWQARVPGAKCSRTFPSWSGSKSLGEREARGRGRRRVLVLLGRDRAEAVVATREVERDLARLRPLAVVGAVPEQVPGAADLEVAAAVDEPVEDVVAARDVERVLFRVALRVRVDDEIVSRSRAVVLVARARVVPVRAASWRCPWSRSGSRSRAPLQADAETPGRSAPSAAAWARRGPPSPSAATEDMPR